jgi:hypothetical protein
MIVEEIDPCKMRANDLIKYLPGDDRCLLPSLELPGFRKNW